MAAVTFIHCHPKVLETEAGRTAVDRALASVAVELKLDGSVPLRESSGESIVVTDVEPRELWRAMDRAVPDWEDRRPFFASIFF